MKFFNSLIILISFILSFHAQADFGPQIQSSIGSSNSSLGMDVNSEIYYSPTNTSALFVSLGFGDVSAQIKFPSKSSEKLRQDQGDTKVTDYQLTYDITNHWRTAAYYQRYEGYFVESKGLSQKQPDLTFTHTGGQLIYIFNSDYTQAMIDSSLWEQTQSAGSWSLSLGLDRFNLDGDLVPQKIGTVMRGSLQEVRVDSLSLRGSYGYNWIWQNWFAGLGYGIGTNTNQIHSRYETANDTEINTTVNTQVIANYGLGAGYKWTRTKLGLFLRGYSWRLKFDETDLTSNTFSSSIYVSMTF